MVETIIGLLVLLLFGGALFAFFFLPEYIFFGVFYAVVCIILMLYLAKQIGHAICEFAKRQEWKGRENER